MRQVYLAAAAVFFFSFAARLHSQSSTFRADIACRGCNSYTGLVAELSQSGVARSETVEVSSDGRIEVRGIQPGTYQLTVRTLDGRVLGSELVSVNDAGMRQTIRITPTGGEAERPVSGTVSAKRLAHKVPKDAKKLVERAGKAFAKGEYEMALTHLRKATEIDPEYMEAHNNLGTAFMQLDGTDEALASFRRASELEPASAKIQTNIAVALMAKKAFAQAEQAARRAIDTDSSELKARFVLGLALYSQRKYTAETADQLRRVQDDYPSARIALAAVQANLGELDLARKTLKEYIASGAQEKRRMAEAMLAQLKK